MNLLEKYQAMISVVKGEIPSSKTQEVVADTVTGVDPPR